uniref:Uncharacterized protein n=1 Tax=Janibacter limosus TaxID=53458 RepID=A0AC61U7Z3_9MICO|nr:2-dehydropantoate 2-reductase N-terminal domain-containing protein [Janibacter limosus]
MPPQIESVAVVGAGAMGAMYAAHPVEGGLRTVLVASGERAQRLRTEGLTVNGRPLAADVADPAGDELPPVDPAIVAVKHHDLAAALDDLAPFVGPSTTYVSVLNGLDSEETIAERFGADRVLLCIALGMAAGREGNEVTYLSPGLLVIGTSAGLADPSRIATVGAALDRAGPGVGGARGHAARDVVEVHGQHLHQPGLGRPASALRGLHRARPRTLLDDRPARRGHRALLPGRSPPRRVRRRPLGRGAAWPAGHRADLDAAGRPGRAADGGRPLRRSGRRAR